MIYINQETGEKYFGGSITISKDGLLFSGVPTEEQLQEWGFTKYEAKPYTISEEESLEQAKLNKIAELELYDQGENVNSFTLNGQEMWLNVSERQQLATQINANESIGRETMTRWFNGHEFTFPIETWKQMLILLEVYAGDAFNVTESHKAAINELTSIEEVESYDFTRGYPQKLIF